MKGWRLIDNHLRKRRESELAFRDALYAATLTRQDIATAPQFDSTARHMLHAWLFDEADLHNLPHQVPYLASCYLDRCLTNISMHNAQIFAEACLVIATKIVAVGGDAMDLPFDVGAQIEIAICQTLHWRLIMPTPYDLLQLHKQLLWLPPASMSRAVEYLRSIVCRSESVRNLPSVLSMVAVLLLERDDLLPPACRVLVFERMKLDRCAGKVLRALSIFKGMGLGNEVEEQEESECSTTVYALSTASEASASWEM